MLCFSDHDVERSKLLVDPGVRFVLTAGRETYGAGL
jgi:hypothetical protein